MAQTCSSDSLACTICKDLVRDAEQYVVNEEVRNACGTPSVACLQEDLDAALDKDCLKVANTLLQKMCTDIADDVVKQVNDTHFSSQ